MKVYVVNMPMSSPEQLLNSEKLDEMSRKLNYKFKEETRRKIHAINQAHKSVMYAATLNFHGIYICKEEQLPALIDEAMEADRELRAIEPSLYATLVSFSLDMADVQKGETYGQVLSYIRYQIIKDVLDRIDKMTENKTINQLSARSREALVKMVDRLKAVNVLNDKDIEKKLESIKTSIEKDSLEIMRKDLIDELQAVTKTGAFLKFRGQGQAQGQGQGTPAPTSDKNVV